MIHIREKTAADGDRIAEIVALATAELRRVYRPVPAREGTAKPSSRDGPFSLVAVDGETVVGVVEYCVGADSLYVQGLAVHPQRRRQGIARTLVHAVERIAMDHDRAKVSASCIRETGNMSLFKKLGFTAVDETPAQGFESADGQPVTRVDMCRILG